MESLKITPKHKNKSKKRVGRGAGSGHGRTACRGNKGQLARSGGRTMPGFEGGQTPLQRRLPKFGFTNIFKKEFEVVNLGDILEKKLAGDIDPVVLAKAGLIRCDKSNVKILGDGQFTAALTVRAHKFSKSAEEKIKQAGGKAEVI